MDENLTKSWSDKGKQPWVYCRLAEIYLNYAEAMYHCGKEDVAREYVNYIRKRARGGREDILPDVTESGEALLAKIQHERKVELAFEEHRFYDVRRWKIAEKVDKGAFHGINITKQTDGTKKYELFKIHYPLQLFATPLASHPDREIPQRHTTPALQPISRQSTAMACSRAPKAVCPPPATGA